MKNGFQSSCQPVTLSYNIFTTQNGQKNIEVQGRSFKTSECQKPSFPGVEFDFASL